jgi:Photosynthetic reaction centre cytochrome C subunit
LTAGCWLLVLVARAGCWLTLVAESFERVGRLECSSRPTLLDFRHVGTLGPLKNIKMLTDVPASRLLGIMNIGFGKSLGVSCTHCHTAGEWDREDKTQKQTARDMFKMVATINNELLKNIPNLKGPNAIVNCTTCHRGQVKPALNLP